MESNPAPPVSQLQLEDPPLAVLACARNEPADAVPPAFAEPPDVALRLPPADAVSPMFALPPDVALWLPPADAVSPTFALPPDVELELPPATTVVDVL